MLTHLALVSHQQGVYDQALALAKGAIAALLPLDDLFYLGLATSFAGMASLSRDDLAGAAAFLEESAALWRRNGYPRGMVIAISALSGLALDKNDLAAAEGHAAHCVQLAASQRDRWGMALALTTLGRAARERGDLPEAGYLYRESGELARELGEQWVLCLALLGGGWTALAAGEAGAARLAFQEVIKIGRVAGFFPVVLEALVGQAQLMTDTDLERASLLLAAVCRHPATDAAVRGRAERHWRDVLSSVGEQRAALVWAAAEPQSLDVLLGRLGAHQH